MGNQKIIVIEEETKKDKNTESDGCINGIIAALAVIGGIVAAFFGVILGVNYLIDSYESKKLAKEQAAASIEETIVADETRAFDSIKKLHEKAESDRAKRLEADRRDDAARESDRIRREAAVKAAAEESAAIEEEARKDAERQSALRDFAMSEAPTIWTTLQKERAERVSLENRLAELVDAFGDDLSKAETDETYLAVLRERNESIRRIRHGTEALEEAFRLSVQSKANPNDETLVEQKSAALLRAGDILLRPSSNR